MVYESFTTVAFSLNFKLNRLQFYRFLTACSSAYLFALNVKCCISILYRYWKNDSKVYQNYIELWLIGILYKHCIMINQYII